MKIRHLAVFATFSLSVQLAQAQYNDSGISAGFFDASEANTIDFSRFHLPPLAVLLENAKSNPQIQSLAKAQEIAQAEVSKQKRHIFSYVRGHASYGYGKTDMWGNNSSNMSSNMIYQFQGSEQSYWNVGVNLAVPLEDILDLKASVRRKKLEVDDARIKKDIAYDQLKLQIVSLYIKITNDMVALKTASENAAIYQGAGQLTQEQFHNGEMSIAAFAETKRKENDAVITYQQMQTQITTDIVTLEILTHTPIITNTTTDISLDDTITKTEKQIAKENKAIQKQIKEETEAEERRYRELEKADEKAKKQAEKEAKKEAKNKTK
ncbi:MAG: TolC family protein [Prevotella sp.]|nr:TolC family protein [Prevotella sp.]MDY4853501.1 TolC family protein [Prevotella sp.]